MRYSHWLLAGLGIPYNDNIHSYDAGGSMSWTPGGDNGAKAKILDTEPRSRSEKLKYGLIPRKLNGDVTEVQRNTPKRRSLGRIC